VLLPQPIQRDLLQPSQRSPLRHEYQRYEVEADSETPEAGHHNPKITINDGSGDLDTDIVDSVDSHADPQAQTQTTAVSMSRPGMSWVDEPYPYSQPQTQELPVLHAPTPIDLRDDVDNNDKDHATNAVEDDGTTSQESVKGLIYEWENVNGRFARTY